VTKAQHTSWCGVLRARAAAATSPCSSRTGRPKPTRSAPARGSRAPAREELAGGIAKGHKARRVPLWWDQGTLDDLTAWRDFRISQNAGPADPLVCSQAGSSLGKPIDRQNARHRFRAACRVLGFYRLDRLTIHHGRHSFVSHALAGLRTLAEVRDAAGHSNIATTSLYTHVATDDDGRIGNLFGFTAPPEVA
jgi:integrase